MAYIGRDIDKLSNIEKLDTITFDGSQSYTLQKGGVNFTPSSANNLQVSIDGVVQAGNFTVSGSTIDFGVAVAGTSTNDFIFHYGTGLITTPADGTVTTAKLADSSVTSAKLDSGVALGKVLQVVTATDSTTRSTSSTSYVTGSNTLTVDITPSSTSNKIFLIVHSCMSVGGGQQSSFTIYRDATNLGNATNGFTGNIIDNGDAHNTPFAMTFLDSPSSTSSLTYQVYFRSHGAYTTSMNMSATACITAFEIGA